MLYDFYGMLLTEKQQQYMELYYREDYSLGEIADLVQVSRQAIYDNIKRTEQLIEKYEENLQLHAKFAARKQLLTMLDTELSRQDNPALLEIVEQLNKLN